VLRTLRRLAPLHGDVPLVVVDNASSDGTADAIASAFPGVRVVRVARNLGAAGRNAGVHACATPYVAFCDDDTWWEREGLHRAVSALDAHPHLAVVTGRVLIGEDHREDPTSVRMAASPFPNTLGLRGSEVFGFLAGACVMRRAAFVAVGGYHRRYFLGGEEELLAIDLRAAGWRMGYVAGAIVHHHPSPVRDVAARRRLVPRNAIWSAWLRRPWRSAWRVTLRRLAEARRDRSALWTGASALRGLPWVLRGRHVVADDVEKAMRTRDAFDAAPLEARPACATRVPVKLGERELALDESRSR
jgi:GT2 family glycosyltransferase